MSSVDIAELMSRIHRPWEDGPEEAHAFAVEHGGDPHRKALQQAWVEWSITLRDLYELARAEALDEPQIAALRAALALRHKIVWTDYSKAS